MNTSLSTFMKIGLSALTIGILIFGLLFDEMKAITNIVTEVIENSMPGGG